MKGGREEEVILMTRVDQGEIRPTKEALIELRNFSLPPPFHPSLPPSLPTCATAIRFTPLVCSLNVDTSMPCFGRQAACIALSLSLLLSSWAAVRGSTAAAAADEE